MSDKENEVGLKLIHRQTGVVPEFDNVLETSLYLCRASGIYILEQVCVTRGDNITSAVTLGLHTLAKLLPHLHRIVEENPIED